MKNRIKEEIKRLAAEQVVCKQNRKTEHIQVERTMSPWQAAFTVQSNRHQLRHLHILYGELRGQSLDEIEPNRKTEPSLMYVETLRKTYESKHKEETSSTGEEEPITKPESSSGGTRSSEVSPVAPRNTLGKWCASLFGN